MKFNIRKPSIVLEFSILGMAIVVLAITLFIWFAVQFCSFYKEKIINILESQGGRIERSFTDAVDHTAYMIDVLISQIRQDHLNLKYIENIMSKFKLNPKVENVLTWTAFSWTNAQHKIVVDLIYGILEETIDLSKRDYMPETVKLPGKIQLGSPVFGSTSKTWMIPAGMGAVDEKGNYIGTMTIGFSIDALTDRLKASINAQGVSFALLDKNLNIILKSCPELEKIESLESDIRSSKHFLLKQIDFLKNDSQSVSHVDILGDQANYYIFKLSKYPYILYLTYDKAHIKQEVWSNFYFRLAELVSMGMVLIFLLILIYFQIIKPLMELSKAANKIAEGETIQKIPRGRVYETTNLALQLIKVKRYMVRERISKEKLTRAIQIAEASDKAREDFIERVESTTGESLETIISLTELLATSLKGKANLPLSSDQQIKSLDTIHQEALHIKNMTTNVLELTYVCIPTLIDQSIMIHAKAALRRSIRLVTEIEKNIPKLYADELKVKQIIVGLLDRALEFSSQGTCVQVLAHTIQDNNKLFLVIKIIDDSFGLDSQTRERIKTFYDNKHSNNNSDKTNAVTSTIKNLVVLHNGHISFEDTYGKGSVVTVILPYLDESAQEEPLYTADNVISLFSHPNRKI